MPRSKTPRSRLSEVKLRIRRRLLVVEPLENRVVLTAQNGLSPFLPEVPYMGTSSKAPPLAALTAGPLGNLAVDRPFGPQLFSGSMFPGKGIGELGTPPTSERASEPEFAPGRWITRFAGLDGAADQQVAKLRQWLSDEGLVGIDVSAPLGLPGMMSLETSPDLTHDQLTEGLSKIPGFQYASQDYKVWGSATFPNDPLFSPYQYALDNYGQDVYGYGVPDADIDAPEAWDLTTGSSSVVVGVIDSGIDFTHPDLADNIWTNPNEVPGNSVDDDSNGFIDDVHGWDFWGYGDSYTTSDDDNDPTDENGHGTHVSGTIGAAGNNADGVAGVAWDISLVPLRFIGPYYYGWISDAAAL